MLTLSLRQQTKASLSYLRMTQPEASRGLVNCLTRAVTWHRMKKERPVKDLGFHVHSLPNIPTPSFHGFVLLRAHLTPFSWQ